MTTRLNPINERQVMEIGRTSTIDDLLKSKHGQDVSGAEVATLTMMGLNPLIFGLPGGAILPLDQYTASYSDNLRYFLVKHEEHAVFAVGGYGAITGIPAFALVTSGPGVLHSMTGLYNENMEFYPAVVVSGNAPLSVIKHPKKRGFQASKAVEGALAFAKNATLVERVEDVQRILMESFYQSMTHPVGSVLVDIPKDIQAVGKTRFKYFKQPEFKNNDDNLDYKILNELATLLKYAERPFVVLGRGALNARAEVWELIEKMGLPFGYTLKGKGVLPDDHPQNYSLVGQHGKISVNEAMRDSDLVIIIGCNGDDRAFLNPKEFTVGKRAIINPFLVNALARLPIDYPIRADAKLAVSELLNLIDGNKQHEKLTQWNTRIRENYDKEEVYNVAKEGISPVDLMRAVDRHFNPDILVLDVGEHQMHAAKLVRLKSGFYNGGIYGHTPVKKRNNYSRITLTSGTAGTMHTSIPYAAGAKLALPNADILTIIGDGGLEMNDATVWLLAANDLDVPVLIMNNRSYGQVNEWLRQYHSGRTEHAQTTVLRKGPYGLKMIPDFKGTAIKYNIPYRVAEDMNSLTTQLMEFKKTIGPRLFDAIVYTMGAYPMIPTGERVEKSINPKN